MREVEHQIAVAFMRWWALSCRRFNVPEELLWATPNGGKRNLFVAMKLKAEGVRAGVADYFLAVPRGKFHGLFLELKAGGPGVKKGRPSPEQLNFGRLVQERGYDFRIVYGTEEAMRAVSEYLVGTQGRE